MLNRLRLQTWQKSLISGQDFSCFLAKYIVKPQIWITCILCILSDGFSNAECNKIDIVIWRNLSLFVNSAAFRQPFLPDSVQAKEITAVIGKFTFTSEEHRIPRHIQHYRDSRHNLLQNGKSPVLQTHLLVNHASESWPCFNFVTF